jgi:hypothetical protein
MTSQAGALATRCFVAKIAKLGQMTARNPAAVQHNRKLAAWG